MQAKYIATTCAPSTNICYALNIPDATAQSGNGDIYFQLAAPTSYQWVALGQGSQMSGSNIFVMYTSADGKNVTVSPRLGTGHVEPQHDTSAKITLLAGSGVDHGVMTANVLCSNCNSWSGGSMDFTGSSGDWIYAHKSGSALNTDDASADISQHDDASSFTWNFASAKGGANVNPFVSSGGSATSSGSGSAATTCKKSGGSSGASTGGSAGGSAAAVTQTLAQPSGSGCPTAWPSSFSQGHWPTARPTWASSCFASGYGSWPTNAPWTSDHNKRDDDDSCDADDDGSGSSTANGGSSSADFSNAGAPFGGNAALGDHIATIHGVLAALSFVALFPIGGILIRVASFTGLIWVHAALQAIAYLVYIVAFGMGIYLATQLDYMSEKHPIIGIVLLVVLLGQPITGFIHHKMFKRTGGRTTSSYLHLGIGRIAILLGIVNGGLGIQLAGDVSNGGKIAYAVVAVVVAIVYIAAIVVGEMRRKRRAPAPPSYQDIQKQQSADSDSSSQEHTTVEHYAKAERQ